MVLELLAALVGAVAVPHRHRPDPPRDAPDHRVLGVHAVGEEERQVRREVVDVHAAREVGLDEGEAVGQREGELRDRVRPGLGDVVAGDRHRVEVAHVVVDEVLLDVAHHLEAELGREDAGVLALVLLQDVGLHGAAHRGERPLADLLGLVVGRLAAVVGAELGELLVDRGVEEHREDRRRRPVDGHRHAGRRVAAGRSRSRAPSMSSSVAIDTPDCRPCRRCRGAGRGRCRRASPSRTRWTAAWPACRRRAGGSAGWCGTGRPRRRTSASGPRSRA